MRIAYADPPYPGMAKKFYSHDPQCAEVDHAELIARLDRDYDSWALSTSSTALRDVIQLAPPGTRIGAWVKTFCAFKRNVNPAYAWEPVLFKTPNRPDRRQPVKDFVSCQICMQTGLAGTKPEAFSFWLFDLLGCRPGDDFFDLFPGSGAVSRAWEKWRSCDKPVQMPLFAAA